MVCILALFNTDFFMYINYTWACLFLWFFVRTAQNIYVKKRAWSDWVLCFPFILSGNFSESPPECVREWFSTVLILELLVKHSKNMQNHKLFWCALSPKWTCPLTEWAQGRIQGEGAGGAHPPPPEMTCGFLRQLIFCKNIYIYICGLLERSKRGVHPLLKTILDWPLC